jgi:hypothetical protein
MVTHLFLTSILVMAVAACNSNRSNINSDTSSGDDSTGAILAGMIGGALSSSSNLGTTVMQSSEPSSAAQIDAIISSPITQEAFATSQCPTVVNPSGLCTTIDTFNVALSLNNCHYSNSAVSWSGILRVGTTGPGFSCGNFPNFSGTSGSIYRQFVNASNNPATSTRTGSAGFSVIVDHGSVNLGNFDSQSIATIYNGGYGSKVIFTSGLRTGLVIRKRVYVVGGFDHSVDSTLSINESGSTRTINSGSMVTYYNRLQIVGNATVTQLAFNNTCCMPVSGTISTTFSAGQNQSPTSAGSSLVGRTETITFNSCGSATLTNTSGTTANVTVNNCF